MSRKVFETLKKTINLKAGELTPPGERYLRATTTLPHIRKKTIEKLDMVVKGFGFSLLPSMPLIVPIKGSITECWVYPNIKAMPKPVDVVTTLKGWLADEKGKAKLEDATRAVKLATKREKTTIAKVLAEHTNIKSRGYRDDKVRDVAECFGISNQPLSLVICEKPEDYYEMFKVKNNSCMTVGNSHYQEWTSKSWVKIAEDTGIYPSAWYHYQPYAKGAYIKAGDIPVARFMLYKTDEKSDKWSAFADVKHIPNFGTTATEFIKSQGFVSAKDMAKTAAPYDVPEVHHELLKVPCCPLPFADYQVRDWSVAYDAENKCFKFDKSVNQRNWTEVRDNYRFKGFIKSTEVYNIPKPVKKEEPAPVAENPAPVEEVAPKKKAAVKKVAAPARKKVEIPVAEPKKPRARAVKADLPKVPRKPAAKKLAGLVEEAMEEKPVFAEVAKETANPWIVFIG